MSYVLILIFFYFQVDCLVNLYAPVTIMVLKSWCVLHKQLFHLELSVLLPCVLIWSMLVNNVSNGMLATAKCMFVMEMNVTFEGCFWCPRSLLQAKYECAGNNVIYIYVFE